MTNRIFIPSMTFGLLLITAIFSYAMSEPDCLAGSAGDESELTLAQEDHDEHQRHRLGMMTTILDLTETQQEQIKQLFSAERDSHKGERQEMHAARETLNELMRVQPFDEAAFRSLSEQQAEKRIDMMVAHAKIKQQVFTILTLEQQEKADELWSLMGKRRRGRGMKH